MQVSPAMEQQRRGVTVIHTSLITLERAVPARPAVLIEVPPDPAAIARRAAGGAFWTLLAFAAGKFLGFGTNIALARLLDPADFGLVSFAMILIGAFMLLQDLGVGAAL